MTYLFKKYQAIFHLFLTSNLAHILIFLPSFTQFHFLFFELYSKTSYMNCFYSFFLSLWYQIFIFNCLSLFEYLFSSNIHLKRYLMNNFLKYLDFKFAIFFETHKQIIFSLLFILKLIFFFKSQNSIQKDFFTL